MRGSVYKPAGRPSWYFTVDLGPDPITGKRRIRKQGGFRTKKAAEDALDDVLGKVKGGGYTVPTRITVRAFLEDEWLPAVRSRLRPSTWETYKYFGEKYVFPNIGATPLAALAPPALNALYADLLDHGARSGRGLAPKTVRHVHQLLRTALVDAVRARRSKRCRVGGSTDSAAR